MAELLFDLFVVFLNKIKFSVIYRGGQKKETNHWNCNNFFWLIKVIPNFTTTYWDSSMWIINNQYHFICRPSISIKCWSLGLNASKHQQFLRNFITFCNRGFFRKIEICYPSTLVYILLQESPDPRIYWI